MFCPHCKSLLKRENGALRCNRCDYTKGIEGTRPKEKENKLVSSVTCRKCGVKGKCIRQEHELKENDVPTVQIVLSKKFKCTQCGFEFDEEDPRELAVFKDLDTMPIDDAVFCPKCNAQGAYWHLRQTRAADEATTRFYRCTKCKHTWREYA